MWEALKPLLWLGLRSGVENQDPLAKFPRALAPELVPRGQLFAVQYYFKPKFTPENVDAREDTTAEEIFRRCSNDMLKPILTTINNSGSSGAPSHPAVAQQKMFTK